MPKEFLTSVDGTLLNPRFVAAATPVQATPGGVVFDLTLSDGSKHQTLVPTPAHSFNMRASQPGPYAATAGQTAEARSLLANAAPQTDADWLTSQIPGRTLSPLGQPNTPQGYPGGFNTAGGRF